MGDALIDVWFSLLGLSYSLAHTYKDLKKLFSCTVDFKVSHLPIKRVKKIILSFYEKNKQRFY